MTIAINHGLNAETFTEGDAEVETLTESSAARMLGVSKITLQRLRNRGEISHFRIGARVLYSPEQLRDYLAAIERKRNSEEKGG